MEERITGIIKKQREFYATQKSRDVKWLRNKLVELRALVVSREPDIIAALQQDFRKPPFESYISEIGIVLSELDLVIKNIGKWSRPKRVRASMLNFPSKDCIISEPYGTVLIIAPWNYPFQLAIAPVVAAIAAGNTVVLKPSELTPATSNLVEDILAEIFEEEHVSVVQGGIPESTELLKRRWDYIFFTGSVPVGKIVAKAAAVHMTPVTLELGGKSPCIIDDSIDLKLTARRIVWGKFLNAGQTCIAPDYLIVQKTIKSELIKALSEEITRVYGKDIEESPDLARIVNDRNFERLSSMLDNVKIAFGGQTNAAERFISPTIIDEPALDSEVMQDEIFGPLLPILTFETDTDLDRIIGNYEKPLSYYVFSNRKSFTESLLKRHSFGGGTINDTLIHFGNHRLPFGGVGHSGMGAYHGRLGFETFTHKKPVVKKANWLDIPVRYAPYTGKLKRLKQLFKWMG